MAGRLPDQRTRKSPKNKAGQAPPYTLPLFPSEEEISICDVVARLCPSLDQEKLLSGLRADSARRHDRIARLRRQIHSNEYFIHPSLVAISLLLEGDLFVD